MSILYHRLLYSLAYFLWTLAILLWIATIVGWLFIEPTIGVFSIFGISIRFDLFQQWLQSLNINFEPLNVLISGIFPLSGGIFAWLVARKGESRIRENEARQLDALLYHCKQNPGVANYVDLALSINGGAATTVPDLIDRSLICVILGEPGSGKTTLLQRLALCASEARRQSASDKTIHPLPFYLTLTDWRDNQSLEHYLRTQWKYSEDPFTYIENGGYVWLFADGLDQLGPNQERKHKQLRTWLESTQRPYRALFTSRTATYQQDWLGAFIPTAEIVLPLSAEQIKTFIANYAGEKAAHFSTAITTQRPHWLDDTLLQLLTEHPARLSMLLQAFAKSDGEGLPSSYGAMIDHYVRQLWEHEAARRTPGWIHFETMVTVCTPLVFSVQFNGCYRTEAIKLLAAGLFTHMTQTQSNWQRFLIAPWLALETLYLAPVALIISLFREFRSQIWLLRDNFTSKQILAYFFSQFWMLVRHYRVSGFWARRRASMLLDVLLNVQLLDSDHPIRFHNPYIRDYIDAHKLLQKQPLTFLTHEIIGRHLIVDQEQVKIAASIASHPSSFLQKVADQDPYAAAVCIASGVKVKEELRQTIMLAARPLIIEFFEQDEARRSLHCAQALMNMGDPYLPRTVVRLLGRGSDNFDRKFIDIMVAYRLNSLSPLLEHSDPNHFSFPSVVSALGRIGDPSVIPHLLATLESATTLRAKLWATAALANLGHEPSRQEIRRYLNREDDTYRGEPEYCTAWKAFGATTDRITLIEELITLLPGEKLSIEQSFLNTIRYEIGHKALHPIITTYPKISDPIVRQILAAALGHIASSEAISTLLPDLEHQDEELRIRVIEVLGNLKASSAVEGLISNLHHSSPQIRLCAINALRQIKDPRSVPALERCLGDTTRAMYARTISEEAAEALTDIWTEAAREAAATYYLDQLHSALVNSKEWDFLVRRIDITGSDRAMTARQRVEAQKLGQEVSSAN